MVLAVLGNEFSCFLLAGASIFRTLLSFWFLLVFLIDSVCISLSLDLSVFSDRSSWEILFFFSALK